MPVSPGRDPFNGFKQPVKVSLRTPQARILQALMPTDLSLPLSEWPLLTRVIMNVRAGYTATSGMVNRVLGGVPEGSSSGDPHKGILELEYVEKELVSIDGVIEINYRITAAGILAYKEYLAARGGKMPAYKDKSICVNDRYKEQA